MGCVAHRLLMRSSMKKNTKLSVQRQTLKSLATEALDTIAAGRPPTTGTTGGTQTGTVEYSRCNSCTFGCGDGPF